MKKAKIELDEKELKTILMWKHFCEKYWEEKKLWCPMNWIGLWEDWERIHCGELESKLLEELQKLNPKAVKERKFEGIG